MLLLLLREAEVGDGVSGVEVVERPGEHPVDVGAGAGADGGLPVGVVAVGLDDVVPGADGVDEALVALPRVDDDVLAVDVPVHKAVVPDDGALLGLDGGALGKEVKVALDPVEVGDVVRGHPRLDGGELRGLLPAGVGDLITTDVSV